jgi:hypothetical protein
LSAENLFLFIFLNRNWQSGHPLLAPPNMLAVGWARTGRAMESRFMVMGALEVAFGASRKVPLLLFVSISLLFFFFFPGGHEPVWTFLAFYMIVSKFPGRFAKW